MLDNDKKNENKFIIDFLLNGLKDEMPCLS